MADKKPAAAAAPAGEAKPKPPIVPIVGAAVLSAVLVGGVMFFLMPKPTAAPAAQGEAAAAGEEGGEGAEAAVETVYVEIKEPLIANLPPGGPAFLQVKAQIGTKGEAGKKAVETHLPAIQSALLAMLRQTTAEELAKPDAMVALQEKALAEANKVLEGETGKKDMVSAVLFTSFVTQ